jgi:hypothetical protein
MGRKSKAVFEFQVRGFNEAHTFKEHGVDQMRPAFRLKDCTDYKSKKMEQLFGRNETPWENIWMALEPTYVATRDATWKARPKQRTLALRQKEVYERHKTEILTGGAGAGGSSRSTCTSTAHARKMAAKVAAQVTFDTGSLDEFTSVYKPSGGGAKHLRGTTTTRRLADLWTRTGVMVEKTPGKGGEKYVNEVLKCKVPGCRTSREHRVLDDGTLCTKSGNLTKHYRKKHPEAHAQISMKTLVVVKSDGTHTRTVELPFEQQLKHHIDYVLAGQRNAITSVSILEAGEVGSYSNAEDDDDEDNDEDEDEEALEENRRRSRDYA